MLYSSSSWLQLWCLTYLKLLSLFHFWKHGFLASYCGSTWYPDEVARCSPGSYWTSSGLSKRLRNFSFFIYSKVFLVCHSFFFLSSPESSDCFRIDWIHLVYPICWFPFQISLTDKKFLSYRCQILGSLAFWMEWWDWKLFHPFASSQ